MRTMQLHLIPNVTTLFALFFSLASSSALVPRTAPSYCNTYVREDRYWTYNDGKIYTFRIDIPAYKYSSGSLTKDCLMNNGAKGDGVKKLQYSINNCYTQTPVKDRLKEDGDYGDLTKAAVRKVQAYIGAGVDGIYGEQTYSLMKFFGTPINFPVAECVQGGAST